MLSEAKHPAKGERNLRCATKKLSQQRSFGLRLTEVAPNCPPQCTPGAVDNHAVASVTIIPTVASCNHKADRIAPNRKRARQAGLPPTTCCHTFRATGITTYLQNGGTIEHAQQIANHESPRTTKLYDRTNDAISLDEIERILI